MIKIFRWLPVLLLLAVSIILPASPVDASDWFRGLWFTPDQQGARLMRAGEYSRAAELFSDPYRRGEALYRDGQFEKAASAFAQINTAAGHFNRANALVMLGKYQEAVMAYDRALEIEPGWSAAEENREIARLRAERLETEGGDMTGGMLGADDISIDTGGKNESSKQEPIDMADGPPLSDTAMRELWLRRIQTKPADFLRSKFAYQHQHREGEKTQ